MPIKVELLNKNRVVLQTYSDPVDAAQMDALKDQMNKDVLANAPGLMHIIADFRQVSDVPRTMLTSGSSMMRRAHPNTGTILVVVQNSFIQTMAQVFGRITRNTNFKVVGSMDDALTIVDALLADPSPTPQL